MSRFDEVIERQHTDSLKYDFAKEKGMPEDVLPLWVADMDFRAPEEVLNALHEKVEHGIFGYSETKSEYNDKIISWFKKRHSWEPEGEWLVKSPGVVFAINCAIRAFTEPGDAVLIQEPVYYPFRQAIENNGRICVNNELLYNNGRYEMDFTDLEAQIKTHQVKAMILCNPHNPVGRVWAEAELKAIGKICREQGVFVIADEIHCDFLYPGHRHTVFLKACPDMKEQCMICTAPSKTFNLAGLQASNLFVPNETKRQLFKRALRVCGYEELNIMGLVACQAAYEYGASWLDELQAYLGANLRYVREFLQKELPRIRLVEPEGTYVIWLDFSGCGLAEDALNERIVQKAGLWLDKGSMFGSSSGQFQRVNIACPRATLEKAMERLKKAFI